MSTYPWTAFYSGVIEHADYVRAAMNNSTTDDIFSTVRASIASLKGMKCEAVTPSWYSIVCEFTAIIRNTTVKQGSHGPLDMRQIILQKFQRAKQASIAEFAHALEVPNCIIEHMHKAHSAGGWKCKMRNEARQLFLNLESSQQYLVHEFMHAWALHLSVRTYPLPEHIAKTQKQTIQKRRCLTDVYICCSCKQIRAFVVDTNSASKNACACGNS